MPDDHPDVLVVLCDQFRADALGAAGDPNVSTPALDGLAGEGVRFSNAYATYPICVPTRFSLLTGEYAHTRGVPAIGYRLSPAERTIADDLSAAGYETAYVGKWHLYGTTEGGEMRRGGYTPVPPAYQGGFDHWRGFEFRNDPYDTAYFVDDDPTPRPVDGHQTDGLVDVTLDALDAAASPSFTVVSFEAPHPPFVAPPAYHERWTDRTLDLRENVEASVADADLPEEYADFAYREFGSPTESLVDLDDRPLYRRSNLCDDLRGYYAAIEHLDDAVGRLRSALDDRERDAVVVFVSDHGELLGSHGLFGKQYPYAESANVPLIVAHPDGRSGAVVDDPVATEDWHATLRGLAGLDPDPDLPGVDATPLVTGAAEGLDRPGVYLEFFRETRAGLPFHDGTWRGFVTPRYTYAVRAGAGDGGEPWLLFDREDDPRETRNLLDGDAPPEAATLHGHLRERAVETGDDYPLAPAFGHDGLNRQYVE